MKKYQAICGIEWPYAVTSAATRVTKDGYVVEAKKPPYITHLERFEKTGSQRSRDYAVESLMRQIIQNTKYAMGVTVRGFEAPIAVSAEQPMGTMYVDQPSGRIILNESEAELSYHDADGDRALAVSTNGQGFYIKFPIHMKPKILKVTNSRPEEVYYDFTKEEADSLCLENPVKRIGDEGYSEISLFFKKHVDVPVGLLTALHNTIELLEAQTYKRYLDRIALLYGRNIDPETGRTERGRDIEDGGMKAARKMGASASEQTDIRTWFQGRGIAYKHAWAFSGSAGNYRLNQMTWVPSANLQELVNDILDLKIEFREVHPTVPEKEKYRFVDGELFDRLKFLKLIRWQNIPHADPSMPPACMITLTLQDGKAVALTDVKRHDGTEAGLTYGFLLYPVWDNLDIWDAQGKEIKEPASHKWVHPINHLSKVLCTFDCKIRSPYGDFVDFWPRSYEDFKDERRAVKLSNLHKFLLEYCGRFGDAVPCTKENYKIVPSQIATYIAARSVTIDYGGTCTAEEMYMVAREANAKGNICIVGSKSTDRRVRKYMLANAWGGSILDKNGLTNPYRGACNRAQLLRATEAVKFKVAIVKMNTYSQFLITPSGAEKQITKSAFLPKVFNTEEEYKHFLEMNKWSEQECPAEVHHYMTWGGKLQACWTIGPKKAIRVGKLVDALGNKAQPREVDQVMYLTEDGAEEIDLIIPYQELLTKEVHHVFFNKAEEKTLVMPSGQLVKALVCEHTFYRSGSASENIRDRVRYAHYTGMESFAIQEALGKIGLAEPRNPDLTEAEELQQCLVKFLEQTGPIFGTDHAGFYDDGQE